MSKTIDFTPELDIIAPTQGDNHAHHDRTYHMENITAVLYGDMCQDLRLYRLKPKDVYQDYPRAGKLAMFGIPLK